MGRFPFGIPNCWFHVSYSDELKLGAVKPVHYFGRDLVLFRGEDGRAACLDAYCPHLGAHLGVGGKVIGNTIRCPFHGWQINPEGKCVAIPYAKKIPPKAETRSWPVQELNGRIFVWHHAEGKEPDYLIPQIPGWGDPEWTSSWQKYRWVIRSQPQEVMENAIDWHHFQTVHLMDPPRERSHKFDGKMFFWNIGTRKTVQTMGVQDDLYMEAQNWGLGFNFLTYTGMFTTVVSAGLTPVDHETLEFATGIIGKKDGRSEEETVALLKAYMDDQSKAIEQDFSIWEAKTFRNRPVLCDGDGPIAEYRRWVRQFYSTPWWEEGAAS
jgi:phenylpropionate dioxygenase-like ring-hydroxylating dioxygenase large terminal subunit